MIGRIRAAHRALVPSEAHGCLSWQLKGLAVCASTETELDRWLAEDMEFLSTQGLPGEAGWQLLRPRAVIARRQRHGHGQFGRAWCSPPGGVWLSAALPWPIDPALGAAPGLAVATGLLLRLEEMGVRAQLKWPNDLLLNGLKLAGFLPGLRLRAGKVRWARVGVGLNGRNHVQRGATNLVPALGRSRAHPVGLAALVLAALEWAMAAADQPETVRALAESRLKLPAFLSEADGLWSPAGLTVDGGLVLHRDDQYRVLRRHHSTCPLTDHLHSTKAQWG